jgi:hypothetical protein
MQIVCLLAAALLLPFALVEAAALPLPNLSFPLLTLLAGFLGGMDFPLANKISKELESKCDCPGSALH